MARFRVKEGSVIVFPLETQGFAVGVVARSIASGICLGYFFGPRLDKPLFDQIDSLDPSKALLVAQFGDLELKNGNWFVVGKIQDWDPNQWPLPKFSRIVEDRAWLTEYDNKFNCIGEVEISVSEAANYPKDRLLGAGAVEIVVAKLLDENY